MDRKIRNIQDKNLTLLRVQDSIAKMGRDVREFMDARLGETLYLGRVAARAQNFDRNEAQPLLTQGMAVAFQRIQALRMQARERAGQTTDSGAAPQEAQATP